MTKSARRRFLAGCALLLASVACSRDPRKASQEHLNAASKYVEQKKYREAIIELRNAVQLDPRSAPAREKLAQVYVNAGEPQNAIKEYVTIADLRPDDADAQLRAGQALFLARRYEDARTRAQKAAALRPRDVTAQILIGNATAGLKDFDAAIKDIEDAIAIDPSRSGAYDSLGAIHLAQGRHDEAEAAFAKAVEIDPTSIQARLALGTFYWSAGRPADAEREFKAGLAIKADNLELNRAMALLSITTKHVAEAEPYLKVAAAQQPQLRLGLAEYYFNTGRSADARRELQQMAAQAQTYEAATTTLARIDFVEGRKPAAYKALDEILARNANAVDALLTKAAMLLADGRRDDALVAARTAVTADPRSARAEYVLGVILSLRGDNDEAQRAFEQVLVLNPRAIQAQYQLGRLHLAAGKPDVAAQYAQSVIAGDSKAIVGHLMLVRALIAKGSLSEAEQELAPLVKSDGNSAFVQSAVGALALAKRDLAAARIAFTRANELDPTAAEPVQGLVALDLAAKHTQPAVERVDNALKRAPDSTGLLLVAARTYAAAGDMSRSEGVLRKVIATEPSNLSAYGMLVRVLVAQHRVSEARTQLAEAASRQPKSVPVQTLLGMLSEMDGRVADAERAYEAALAADTHAAVAANNLAWLLAESGRDAARAVDLAQTARTALPDDPRVLDTVGWAYVRREMFDAAVQALEQSASIEPKSATTQYHLGIAYAKSGYAYRDKARAALQEALRLEPAFAGAADAQKLLQQLGS